MKTLHKSIFASCLSLIICLSSQTVNAKDDWNYWSSYTFEYKLTDKTSFVMTPQLRLREDISQMHYWESVQGFKYKFHPNLDFGLFHLYADDQNAAGKWTDENRARVEATLKWQWGEFNFSDRQRYEYRVVGAKPKSRIRNQLKIAKTIEIGNHKITPYIANEAFYAFRANEFNQNRTTIGVSKKIADNATAGIYYLLKLSRSKAHWTGSNIIGTSIKLSL